MSRQLALQFVYKSVKHNLSNYCTKHKHSTIYMSTDVTFPFRGHHIIRNLVKPIYNNGIITTAEPKYRPDPRGAGYAMFTHLQKHFDKIMQVDGYTGEKDTFRSALQRSIQIALKLQEYGINPTDTVSICTSNHLNSCVAVFASLFVGAKIVCFDHQMHVTEATLLMKQVDPKLIFVGLEGLDFIETLLKSSEKTASIIVFGQTTAYTNFFDLLSPCVDEEHFTIIFSIMHVLIKYQSWHVAPKIIENLLISRADISAACVVGIPHNVDDEHPMAFVELKGMCKSTENIEDNICQFVERSLGNNFKLRGGIKIVDKIPFTSSGKYDARTLKREFLKGV